MGNTPFDETPLITVFTSCFNQGRYLKDAINSVLNQTHKNIEYIIYDDGSTDNTWDIIQEYAKTDNRIKIFRLEKQPNVGVVINRSIDNAKGIFWTWCPADDIFEPNLLSMKLEYSKKYNHKAVLYSDWIHIDDAGNEIGTHCPKPMTAEDFKNEVWLTSPIGFTGIWIPTNLFKEVGKFPEHLKYSEDFYWMIKATIHKVPFIGIPQKLYKKRLHANRMSNKFRIDIAKNVDSIRNELEIYRNNLFK